MSMIKVGDLAPDFALSNQDNEPRGLQHFAGRFIILYFYPQALTPGCTTQACGLRDSSDDFAKCNATVLGISPDPVPKLKKFAEKYALNFDLLSDSNHGVAESYGVWGLKKFMGKEFMGIRRTTFVIDPHGRIAAVVDKFKTSDHHNVVIDWLRQRSRALNI